MTDSVETFVLNSVRNLGYVNQSEDVFYVPDSKQQYEPAVYFSTFRFKTGRQIKVKVIKEMRADMQDPYKIYWWYTPQDDIKRKSI